LSNTLVGVEGLTGLQHGKSNAQELMHGGCRDSFTMLSIGSQPLTKGAKKGIAAPRGEDWKI